MILAVANIGFNILLYMHIGHNTGFLWSGINPLIEHRTMHKQSISLTPFLPRVISILKPVQMIRIRSPG
jgi:hypothetical protein